MVQEEVNNLGAKLEALLFLYGEPVKIKKLVEILNVKEREIEEALQSLAGYLNEAKERGLSLIIFDDRAQLITKADLKPLLTQVIKDEVTSPLTPASQETLSIIAYVGPCSRALIEHLRGVNSSFILRSLLVRGLVERRADPKRPNTFLYQVTFDFLRHIGINSPEQLPEYERYKDLVQSFIEGESTQPSPPVSETNNSPPVDKETEPVDPV